MHLSLKQRAYQLIKEKLLNQEFSPGARIREDLLAEEIEMSRTPVREAINQLTAEGFIKNIPRKGLYCIEPTQKEIADLLSVRKYLEMLAIEQCVEKITGEDLDELDRYIKLYEEALAVEDFKTCNKYDSAFHMGIAKATKNQRLIKFLSEIDDFMHIARAMEKKTMPKDRAEKALNQHKKILAYIRSGEVEMARKEMINNIRSLEEHLGLSK
ncbi:MAG TPA: GntR family transcriptional regulator [Bacillota bacterium]